jgi:hypothetical protein
MTRTRALWVGLVTISLGFLAACERRDGDGDTTVRIRTGTDTVRDTIRDTVRDTVRETVP